MMTDRELKNALMTFIFGLVSGLCIATLIIGIVNQPKSDLSFQDTGWRPYPPAEFTAEASVFLKLPPTVPAKNVVDNMPMV